MSEKIRSMFADIAEDYDRVNTILSTQKLENSGYIPRSAHDALLWCLQNYE